MVSFQAPDTLQLALNQLLSAGLLRPLDVAFAEFIAELNQRQPSAIQYQIGLLAAYVSQRLGEQDSCVVVKNIAQPFAPFASLPAGQALSDLLQQADGICQPVVAQANRQPLVWDGERLYLQRYWHYEQQLAGLIRHKAAQQQRLDKNAARMLLDSLFPTVTDSRQQNTPDWQKMAVCVAALQKLSIITGGPGTGKTTTVTRLMALLQGLALQADSNKPLIIQLVAPTGKAAARLSESILQAKSHLPVALQAHLPDTCSTVHRLLGAKANSPYFIHDQQQPLHLDLLILDEASMVDLPLMSKLFVALPEHAQVVMLGDKDQLASVEAGSVLSDICVAALAGQQQQVAYSHDFLQQLRELCGDALPAPLLTVSSAQAPGITHPGCINNNLVVLQKSHRFAADSGIGQLARSIHQGEVSCCLSLLRDTQWQDISWHSSARVQQLVACLMAHFQQYFAAVKAGQPQQAFELLSRQQVLCAQRRGDWGVEQLNALIESELHCQGLIEAGRDYYPGRPLMLTQNDHQLRLFNGDIGIVMPDPKQAQLLKAWFINPDGHLRSVLLGRLPPHETLYAMTIHKSQGSEFAEVYLCLPQISRPSQARGLSRELLYTGLTRARQRFHLYANTTALQYCLGQQVARGSGLAEYLK